MYTWGSLDCGKSLAVEHLCFIMLLAKQHLGDCAWFGSGMVDAPSPSMSASLRDKTRSRICCDAHTSSSPLQVTPHLMSLPAVVAT